MTGCPGTLFVNGRYSLFGGAEIGLSTFENSIDLQIYGLLGGSAFLGRCSLGRLIVGLVRMDG